MGSLTVTITDVNGEMRRIEGVIQGVSLMEVAKANGVDGIFADCGGGCSCATCHVYVAEDWLDRVGQADDIETDMLDMAANPQPNSRLSCQIKLTAALNGLEVTVAPA